MLAASLAVLAGWSVKSIGIPAAALAATIAAFSLVVDARILRIRIPTTSRQVPERWRQTFGPHVTALLYGVGLGTAVTTRVYFAATYAVFLVAGLVLTPAEALIVGAAYGFARGVSPWIAHSGTSLERLECAVAARHRYRPVARGANIVSLAALVVALALTTT